MALLLFTKNFIINGTNSNPSSKNTRTITTRISFLTNNSGMYHPKTIAYIIGIVLTLLSFNITAQSPVKTNDNPNPSIQVKARAQEGRILLRWAVDQPTEWQKANKSGFIVERYHLLKDTGSQARFQKMLLTQNPLKPQALEKWRTIVQKDDNAAIIAQSLYGQSFAINQNGASKENFSDILSKTDEVTLRYSFALLAADMNFEAACMAGWGFIDSTADANVEYYYRVYVASGNSKTKIDTGVVVVNPNERQALAKPAAFKGFFGNKTASLTWDKQWQNSLFTSYILERSEDNTTFKSVTVKPIININNGDEQLPNFSYNDTLPSNDKMYYYRLKGITCFGEMSPPTEVVKGIGRERMSFSPNIASAETINDSTVVLKWDMRTDSTTVLLASFELSLSDQADGTFSVVEKNINKSARSVTFKGLLPSNYFVVSAVDKNGEKYASFPYLVQTIDETPPSPPVGLEGIIDSNGIVQLKWTANTERDLLGYQVFKANVKDEEPSLLTSDPLSINQFSDTISTNLGNEKIYYSIVALDQRFNQSKMSVVVEITKPDKTLPIAPVFKDFKLSENKVELYWDSSSSEDAVAQRLYKKVVGSTSENQDWELLKEFNSLDSVSYTDTKVTAGQAVAYTLMAVDKNKNESPPSVPLTLTIPFDKKNKAAVKDLHAVVDRKSQKILVEWTYSEKGIAEYQIYKTSGKDPLTLWKVAENSTVAIVDDSISPSNIYKYAVRAVFNDGTMSQWKEVSIEF